MNIKKKKNVSVRSRCQYRRPYRGNNTADLCRWELKAGEHQLQEALFSNIPLAPPLLPPCAYEDVFLKIK